VLNINKLDETAVSSILILLLLLLLLLLESCLQTCMTITIAEYTVNNSWVT
jgi:hypothetical protein